MDLLKQLKKMLVCFNALLYRFKTLNRPLASIYQPLNHHSRLQCCVRNTPLQHFAWTLADLYFCVLLLPHFGGKIGRQMAF